MKNKSFLPAGALYFTLQLSIFIVLILSAFVSWVYLNQQIRYKAEHKIEAEKDAREAIRNQLHRANIPQDADENYLSSAPYGLFDVLIRKEEQAQAAALAGTRERDSKTILYLPNRGQSLYLGRGVELEGNVHTAQAGIRSTHLGAAIVEKKQLNLNYSLLQSQSKLPELLPLIKERIARLLQPNKWVQSGFSFEQRSIKNSFFEPLHIVEINDPTRLENIELTGNIWIRSTAPLSIASSAKIHDVLLSAPQIRFESGFEGRLQAFASERLQVEENSQFHYPSVLWVAKQEHLQDTNRPSLRIGSRSKIDGIVGYTQIENIENITIHLALEEQVSIYGRVYCTGLLSSVANIVGSVYTNDIGVIHRGVLYKNHLLQGSLINDVHHSTSGDLPFEASTSKKVLQWLY